MPELPDAERLAYWYFRLNGFLTTENFVVHPDRGSNQRSDADILGVRFSHRQEQLSPMPDDPAIADSGAMVKVILAEVKKGLCDLNKSWTDPESTVLQQVLRSIGCVPAELEPEALHRLAAEGRWCQPPVDIRLVVVGDRQHPNLPVPVQQIIWTDVIHFIVERFREYQPAKRSVGSWRDDGRHLGNLAVGVDPENRIREAFDLPPAVRR